MHQYITSHNLLLLAAGLILAASAASCSSDDFGSQLGSGRIQPSLTVDPGVVTAEDVNQTTVIDTVPSPGEFSLMLTEQSTGRSHLWQNATDFPTADLYLTGTYTLTAFHGDPLSEGYDAAFYLGETTFDVRESVTATPTVECRLFNTMVDVGFGQSVSDTFAACSVLIHAEGGSYLRYPMGETRPMFLRPGPVMFYLDLTDRTGRSAIISAASIDNALVGYYYHLQVEVVNGDDGTSNLQLSFSKKIETDDVYIPITDSLFDNVAPTVTYSGFESSQLFTFAEGSTPAEPLTLKVASPSLKSVILTTVSVNTILNEIPPDIDLLAISDAEISRLDSIGLVVERSPAEVGIDFTPIMHLLRRSVGSSVYSFTVVGVDSSGGMSEPVELRVEPLVVPVSVVRAPDITVGSSRASIILSSPGGEILAPNITVEILNASSGEWEQAQGVTVTLLDDGNSEVGFDVDPLSTSNIEVRVSYCGTVCSTLTLTHVSPQFAIEADPYAHKAVIRIIPFDEADLGYIVSNAIVYVDGQRGTIIDRDPSQGQLTVSGLTEATRYTLSMSVMDHPDSDNMTLPLTITTEPAPALRNGDFEDTERQYRIRDLASGGRYSQNFVEIFNQQNRVSYDLYAPENWANTNNKTLSSGSGERNTWYMQPSCAIITDAASGAYAVELTTVAWDCDGAPIPDYLQQSQPFISYSMNVPLVRYRAVGKLFLGSYRFDQATLTETYDDIVGIESRPSSLNGFYRYTPGENMPGDVGRALIEVFGSVDGQTVVIARSAVTLQAATSYTAFSAPLTYTHFGVKATGIRVMLSSSTEVGSISFETQANITTVDPERGCSRGSVLCVDNLSLSY